MACLYTIGYQRKPLATFIGQLREAGVDAVIDIRLRNTSQLAGFSKRDDLAFLLRKGFGIDYEHHLDLAPTPEILDAYKKKGLPVPFHWTASETTFDLPLYYGRIHRMIYLAMFDRYIDWRFFMSPTGGGGNVQHQEIRFTA